MSTRKGSLTSTRNVSKWPNKRCKRRNGKKRKKNGNGKSRLAFLLTCYNSIAQVPERRRDYRVLYRPGMLFSPVFKRVLSLLYNSEKSKKMSSGI